MHGVAKSPWPPRATPGSQCHVETAPTAGPRSLLAAEISGAHTCAAVPSGDVPLHCALILVLLPSRLWRGHDARRPEPLLCLLLSELQWVW